MPPVVSIADFAASVADPFALHEATGGGGGVAAVVDLADISDAPPPGSDRAVRSLALNYSELTLGLIPGSGGTVSLPGRIGRHRTAWLALTGSRIGVERALRWGLIDEIA